ncbi:glycosyl transferase [Bacteroidia bacterium]|nr:glycosyl transferase [Bacteroidia bacterium]
MIPKVIHYCWFSGDPQPPFIRNCINSWKKVMPDYEIKCWDDNSFDFDSVPFVKQAIEARKWAFAADYVRLYALYTEGGVYLDSDVEVFKRFDCFLHSDFFIGTERISSTEYLPEAAIMGAQKGHVLLPKCMEYYQNRNFELPEDETKCITIPRVMNPILKLFGYEQKDETQKLQAGITVYSTDFFDNGLIRPKTDIYAWHKNAGSWLSKETQRGRLYKWAKKYDCLSIYRLIEKVINKLKGLKK